MRVDFSRYPCTERLVWNWNNFVWINLILLILCTVHMLLSIKYISDIGKRYKKLKKRYQERYEAMSETEHQKKLREAKKNQSYVRTPIVVDNGV